MNSLFWVLGLLTEIGVCTSKFQNNSTSFRHLADALHISDANTRVALQNATQAPFGDDAASRARQACALSHVVFNGQSLGSDDITLYLDSNSNSSLYLNRVQNEWSDNCWQNPSCVLSPTSSEDVARIMTIITSTQAKFSVRSGGHDFNVNHSDIGSTGVLIDMVHLNSISLSADKSNVTIGTGAQWGAVYQALNGTGVSVNGGKSPNPGIGGQTLGGGHGWLTDLAGVTAASVIAAEVVVANATVVQATESYNSELLWALKGGGPNFGIVTQFTYKTLPIDKVWFAQWLFAPTKNQQLINALVTYRQLAADDTKASIVYQLSVDQASNSSFVGFFYTDPVEFPPVFEPFYAIEPDAVGIDSTFGTLADLALNYYAPQYPDPGVAPSRDYAVSTPHLIDNATYQESYAAFESLAKQALSSGWIMNYGSQAISKTGTEASSNTPLGLEPVGQDWAHVTINWDSPEDDVPAKQLIHKIGQCIDEIAYRQGSNLSYRFMNDAYDGQGVLVSYGPENFQKLSSISQAYDMDGTFQRLQNGGWLLSREIN